jgi:hypothetical protein
MLAYGIPLNSSTSGEDENLPMTCWLRGGEAPVGRTTEIIGEDIVSKLLRTFYKSRQRDLSVVKTWWHLNEIAAEIWECFD